MRNPISTFVRTFGFHFLAVFSLVFLSCAKDDSLVDPKDLKGTIILQINDAGNNMPLDAVDVSFISGPTGRTDANGQAIFGGVTSGAYLIRLSRAGYYPSEVNINAALQGTGPAVPITMSAIYTLNKRGVSVKGRIMLRHTVDTTLPASDVAVELRLGTVFVPPNLSTRTNALGEFTFDSLPELTTYTVRVPEFVNLTKSYTLTGSIIATTLYAGQQHDMAITFLNPIVRNTLQVLTSSSVDLVVGQPLIVTFSNGVDVTRLASNSIQLQSGFTPIIPAISWPSPTQLSVSPYQSNWVPGVTYRLTLQSMFDVLGNSLQGTGIPPSILITGEIAGSPGTLGKVANLRMRAAPYLAIRNMAVDTTVIDNYQLSGGFNYYRLLWNRVAGSLGYDLYMRESVDSAWKFYGTTNSADETTITNILAPTPLIGRAWIRYHMVLPKSSEPVSLALSDTVTMRDGVKPSLYSPYSYLSLYSGTGFDNTAGTATRTLLLSTVGYAGSGLGANSLEPMDTAATRPTIRIAEGGPALGDSTYVGNARFVWTSLTAGRVEVDVAASRNGRGDTVVVDFTGVRDLAGNLIETGSAPGSTTPTIRYYTSP